MKLTRRGKQVRAVLILALIVGAYFVATHLWWTPSGYCWGTMESCEVFG
jgi:hypothetical protein